MHAATGLRSIPGPIALYLGPIDLYAAFGTLVLLPCTIFSASTSLSDQPYRVTLVGTEGRMDSIIARYIKKRSM